MSSEQKPSKIEPHRPISPVEADNLTQRLKNITDHLPGVIFRYRLAPDGKDALEYVSQNAEKIWGISAAAAMADNQQIWACYDPRDLPSHRESIAHSAQNLSFWTHEWRFHHPDGSLRWHRGQGQAYPQEDGSIIWDSLITDITAEKTTEAQLQHTLKDLNKRISEQACLYQISRLSEQKLNLRELLQQAVDLIPSGFRFPELTRAAIRFSDQIFTSPDYVTSNWCLSSRSPSLPDPDNTLHIDVYTLADCPPGDPGPFLHEEQHLLDTLAEHLALKIQQKEIQQRYQYATQATSDAVWDWNIETDKLYWGKGFERLFDHRLDQMKSPNSTWIDLIHPEDTARIQQSVKNLLESSENKWQEHYRFRKANGDYALVSDQGIVVREPETGKPLRMVGAVQDVTQLQSEQQRLKLLESVVTQAKDAVLITEATPLSLPGPRIIYVNQAFEQMTGYLEAEVLGKTPRFLQGPLTETAELKRLSQALRNAEACKVELINYKKNGEPFWVQLAITPVTGKNGACTHFFAIQRDISDRKQRKQRTEVLSQIRELFSQPGDLSEALESCLQKILSTSPYQLAEVWLQKSGTPLLYRAAYALTDPDLQAFASAEQTPVVLKKGQGLPGRVWQSQQPEYWDEVAQHPLFLRQQEAQHAGLQVAYGLPLQDQETVLGVLMLASKDRLHSSSGKIFSLNFGQQLGIEIQRKQLKQELSQIFHLVPDVLCITDLEGRFRRVNPAMSALLGYTESELLQMRIQDLRDTDASTDVPERLPTPKNTGGVYTLESRYLTRHRQIVWLSWTSVFSEQDNLVYSVARDITAQKSLALRLEKTYMWAQIGTWEFDLKTKAIFWSNVTRQIHEVSDPGFHPDLEQGLGFYLPADQPRIQAAIDHCMSDGQAWDIEAQITTAKDNVRWVRCLGEAEFEQGQCRRLFGSFMDIHARKTAEIEREKKTHQLSRLASVNQALLSEKNTILESIGDGFVTMDHNYVVTYWNQQAEVLTKMPRSKVINKYFGDVFGDVIEDYKPHYDKAIREQVPVHFESYYPPLNCWFDISAYPSAVGLSIYFRDVTNRFEYVQAIEAQNKTFRDITWMQSHVVRTPLARIMGLIQLMEIESPYPFSPPPFQKPKYSLM